jgi:hypothetical protein
MSFRNHAPRVLVLAAMLLFPGPSVPAQDRQIPDVLRPWQDWVTWSDVHRDCPTTYRNADEHLCFWPSRLSLAADQDQGRWEITVRAFARTWVPLPGSDEIWPLNVRAGDEPVAVVQREGRPTVDLPPGRHELSGEFRWEEMPQRIAIPPQIGLLSLRVQAQEIRIPTWDDQGQVWLQRRRTEEAEKDLLAARVYRVLEDGVPMWLRTDIELTVSGKSREEDLGWILPEGWQLATVTSPIPVAIDEQGRTKAQVRAGTWTIGAQAFRTQDTDIIQFAAESQPVTDQELVGFRAAPTFRLAELEGLPAVDVTQTTFPDKWRNLPVYQWQTGSPFRLTEKLRGMELRQPEGLNIERTFWLDEDGEQLTYRDRVRGTMQRIWRLDVARDHRLGAVRIDGQGQLITENPETKSSGVEVRTRNLNLDAIGRLQAVGPLPANGWDTDADSLAVTWNLPPGWRAFAMLGADRVVGDWLTAWSLLDLFLLLVFALAVFRICGLWAGLVAFLAFGLAYHEPGAPRLTWLFLLIPVALLRLIPEGAGRRWVTRWKYLAVALLLINLVPFVARQVQSAIYPQLESAGVNYAPRGMFWRLGRTYQRSARVASMAYESVEFARGTIQRGSGELPALAETEGKSRFESANLLYDPRAQIQTGPAEPDWTWNQVRCFWDGPVTAQETLRPILISQPVHRVLTVLRVVLLLAVAAVLLGAGQLRWPHRRTVKGATVAASICLLLRPTGPASAAEIPSPELLNTLRERLLEPADAYPAGAEISTVRLQVTDDRVVMEAEIHTALDVAVPLPGRLPLWSPLTVTVDGQPAELVRRHEGYLWTMLTQGVHRVVVESTLPDASEWQWTFLLRPHRVTIDAPDWTVSGVGANGVPEAQVFFVRQQETAAGQAAYDRKDFAAVVAVNRYVETGRRWQIRTKVTRLSAPGKAISLQIPLLPGESVLSAGLIAQDGTVDVRLGPQQNEFTWDSDLPAGDRMSLRAPVTDQWVERWHLLTSPVWNVAYSGLGPIFEAEQENLIPVWHPWPGEAVDLTFSKPEPVPGDTVTVQRVQHETNLGNRQRTASLSVEVQSSLGGEFAIGLPSSAEITSLKTNGQEIPVRRDGDDLVVPLQPGRQEVQVAWRTNDAMRTVVHNDPVQLAVDAANVTSGVRVPESRWVLWADGPLRGPAVRFWTILAVAMLTALVLGSLPRSPLRRWEWVLLAIGLTQVHIAAALVVVAWLFLLALRGHRKPGSSSHWVFNLGQIGLVLLTIVALGILIVIVGEGLLGNPDMFVVGNGSTQTNLQWFQPLVGQDLPEVRLVSISVWFYRLLMLLWALWLAAALLRWLRWGWYQLTHGGGWRRKSKITTATPVQ